MSVHCASWLSAVVTLGLFVSTTVEAQQIWLAPQGDAADRMELFKSEAPWRNAASHTQVFKFYANTGFNAPPQEEVNVIVSDLKRRGIAIGLEAGVMNVGGKPKPACGGWGSVEGYGPVAMHEVIARKIKKAGGSVKYIAMDEPLWFGHYYTGKPGAQPGCHLAIGDVVKLILPSLEVYMREFPDVIIGDIEPSNALANQPNWQRDYAAWATEFRSAVGRPLAFLQLDAAWAQQQAPQHARMVYGYAQDLIKRRLLGGVGVIYNGNSDAASDAAWVQSARNHVLLMERDYGLQPDQAVFQSWVPHPTHTLPETSSDTLTSLLDWYVGRR
jgi:hypothetical protein